MARASKDKDTGKKTSLRRPLNSHHKPTDSISDDGKHRGRNRRKDSNTCVKCLRGTLTCYNVILVLIGVGGLAAGVWLMLKDFSASEVSALLGVDMFEISAYLLIAGGGVVALLAFCGCCGTMKEDKCVLGFYATTLTLMLLLLVGGAVVAFIARDYLEIRLQDNFKKTLQTKYGVDVRTNSENRLITDAWDSVQRELECCGVHGGVMSTTSWSFYKSQSEWYRLKKEKTPLVPESCCKPDGNRQLCTGDQFKGPPIHAVDESLGRKENPHLYSNGCFDKVLENIQEHSLLIGLVSACIPIFLIVGVVVSCCLCFKVEKDPDDDDDSDFYGGRPV